MKANSRIDKLKKQRDTINARIQLIQNKEKTKNLKDNTRRKILVGSYFLEQAELNDSFKDLQKLMSDYLTRNLDRKLFDLEPIKNNE